MQEMLRQQLDAIMDASYDFAHQRGLAAEIVSDAEGNTIIDGQKRPRKRGASDCLRPKANRVKH
jgi:hypothetical protein